ncbi:MAG: transcriptional activator NhaR [Deltaproteobacteria bacterium]|nr:transcriptional activator NhaR [Deltaproteobacteria bacterium]
MEWLNYHHLLYFWMVAREGGLAPAAAQLRLAQPTLSGQIHRLEATLGEKLFSRVGRRLELTEVGRVAYRYADEIFSLGKEFMDSIKGRPTGRPLRLNVGVADVVPKMIVRQLLEPTRRLPEPVRLVCREDKVDRLLAELALHSLDVVLADAPVAPGSSVKAFSHLLGECGVSFMAAPELARRFRRGFPRSLDGAPVLLPTENTSLRRSLEQWFDGVRIRPVVVAEFDDSALLNSFAQDGAGVFATPSAVEKAVQRQYQVRLVARVAEVRERFFAITVQRRLLHPAVVAVCGAAREGLFGRAAAANQTRLRPGLPIRRRGGLLTA